MQIYQRSRYRYIKTENGTERIRLTTKQPKWLPRDKARIPVLEKDGRVIWVRNYPGRWWYTDRQILELEIGRRIFESVQ